MTGAVRQLPGSWAVFLNPLLGVASCLLCLAVVELVLRTTHLFDARIAWSQPDELLGYRYAPHAPYWNRLEGGRSSGLMNNFGWRDVDWTLEKPPGILRVAVIGDSYVEAFQVELPETFPKIAERQLERRGRKVQVMSFAQSGFTTTEELLVLQRDVLPFQPDLVVLFFFPYNDIRDVSKALAPDALRPFFSLDPNGELVLDTSFNRTWAFRLRRWINPVKRRSALVSLLVERWNAQGRNRARAAKAAARPDSLGYLSLCTARPDPRFVEAFDLNKRLIVTMARTLGTGRMMLVTMESAGWKPEDEAAQKAIDPSFDAFCFEQALGKLASSEGIHHIGLQTVFREDWERNRRALHWAHYNQAGHELVGAALADGIERVLPSLSER